MSQSQLSLPMSPESTTTLEPVQVGLTKQHQRVLGRMVVFAALVAVLALVALTVRVSTDRLTQDIRLYEQQTRAAMATRRQLQLDLATRASHARLEEVSVALGLVAVPVQRVQRSAAMDGVAP